MTDISSFYSKKAEESKKAKKFEEALIFTDKAKEVKDEEKSDDYWYKKAVRFHEFGEYENAIECIDKDLSIHKKSYKTYFLKAKVLMDLKKYSEAIEYFNKAAEEKNQLHLQNSKKMESMKKVQKFEKALLYTDLTVNQKQLDSDFWHRKGCAYLKMKKYDNANECYTYALKMKEGDPEILYDHAKCMLFLGNEERCLSILEKCCSLHSIIEKLRIDEDFSQLSNNNKFRSMIRS